MTEGENERVEDRGKGRGMSSGLKGCEESGPGAVRDVEFTRRGSLDVVVRDLFDFRTEGLHVICGG